ncbi:MAG: CRISPR-associated protein Cas5 [Candidatus Lokiarchaeota archaeon]|nr:CRISPR-associated protein Cas5 [Candidatus Lokiarchaeota archaeon]
MKGLSFEVEVPYFSTFRKPSSTSLMLSFIVPPFTTIRGLISNAMGLARDDLYLQDKIKIGIAVKRFGEKNVEMAKILKLKEMPGQRTVEFPSSPMFREFLVNPVYTIYVGGESDVIKTIHESLANPKRPLYLGQSDDLVEIQSTDPIDIFETESNEIWSVVEGIVPGAIVEKIPYRFEKNNGSYSLVQKIISIGQEYPISTIDILGCYKFNQENIYLF